jgi:hypothetical protein
MTIGAGGGAAGGAAAAAAAAIANAVKASGAIVRVESHDFLNILDRVEDPLVVCGQGRFLFSTVYQYLTSYKALYFYCKNSTPLTLPSCIETVAEKKIWGPA